MIRVVLMYRQDLVLTAHLYPEATIPLALACSGFGTASAFLCVPFSPSPEAVLQMPTGGEVLATTDNFQRPFSNCW